MQPGFGTQEVREEDLHRLRANFVARGVKSAHGVFIHRARGSELWDVAGRRYIDFAGGIGALNVGHNHPRVVEAVRHQLDHLTHCAFQVAAYEPYLRLAERLCAVTPGEFPKKAVFFSTGAEAVENAVKIARSFTHRPAVVSFHGAFHGRTLLGLSLTGTANPYKQDFGPFAPEIYSAPYPYEYRGWDTRRALWALEELFACRVSPDRVAAVIIEPVLGEGGFVPAPFDFLQELRRLTQQYGILLIVDEIQSGFGRTGKMFAIEHSGVMPDLVVVAKSLAAGLPLSGVVGRADVMDAPAPGGLGGTYGGNPLACAAALAVLDIIREEDLVGRAAALGALLQQRFHAWKEQFPLVGDVRVLGCMAALELVVDRRNRTPAGRETAAVLEQCRERGLLVLAAGKDHSVIRMLMPLNIPDSILEEGLRIVEAALELISGQARGSGL